MEHFCPKSLSGKLERRQSIRQTIRFSNPVKEVGEEGTQQGVYSTSESMLREASTLPESSRASQIVAR